MEVEDQLQLEAAKYQQLVKSRIEPLQARIEEQKQRIGIITRESDGALAQVRTLSREVADKESTIKSNLLDLKLTQKELKLKDEKLTEIMRRETELMIKTEAQRKEIDKLTTLKEEKAKEIAALKEQADEAGWLKKEMDSVSGVLLEKGKDLAAK